MTPLDTDGRLQVTGTGPDDSEQAVVATLEQLLTGLRVGEPSLDVQCSECGTTLGAGDSVSVHASRPVETPRWHLASCRCPDCAPDEIQTPTRGVTEVRATARLAIVSTVGSQQHWLCLGEPTVSTVSPPEDGTPH